MAPDHPDVHIQGSGSQVFDFTEIESTQEGSFLWTTLLKNLKKILPIQKLCVSLQYELKETNHH